MPAEHGHATGWQPAPAVLAGDDEALIETVTRVHQHLLETELAGDPLLNRRLAVEHRALRRLEDWRVLLLLTPWMLARLLFPDHPPPIAVPAGWIAEARAGARYLVLGPSVRFELLGQPQQAHLNFHPALGHYLLQPLCLELSRYADADAVFSAWAEVIRVRDANLAQARRDCPLQREISRRELFRRLGRGG